MVVAYLILGQSLTIYDPIVKYTDLVELIEHHKNINMINANSLEIDEPNEVILDRSIEFNIASCDSKMIKWLMGHMAIVNPLIRHVPSCQV